MLELRMLVLKSILQLKMVGSCFLLQLFCSNLKAVSFYPGCTLVPTLYAAFLTCITPYNSVCNWIPQEGIWMESGTIDFFGNGIYCFHLNRCTFLKGKKNLMDFKSASPNLERWSNDCTLFIFIIYLFMATFVRDY